MLCDHAGTVPISVMARVIKTVFPRMLMFTSSDRGSHISLLIPLRRAVPTAKLDSLETLCGSRPGCHSPGLDVCPRGHTAQTFRQVWQNHRGIGEKFSNNLRDGPAPCVVGGRDSILQFPKKTLAGSCEGTIASTS